MSLVTISLAIALSAPVPPTAIPSQNPQLAAIRNDPRLDYVTIADLVLQAPLVIDGAIRSAARIRGAEALGVAPGRERYYVEVDVLGLVRGTGGLPPRVGYLVDVPLDARGRAPRLKGLRMIAFARPVAGRPAQVQLVSLDAQQPWSPELDAQVRAIAREVVAPDAPPQITGIGNAFHVPGTLPGEGETQIFLTTARNDPVSLSILRRPGQAPRWGVALGEIVDDSAEPPRRDTLLWYRLACGLPDALPETALQSTEPDAAMLAREDYQFVRRALGPCPGRGATATY
ncbi:hypothetical protein [Sphingomonas japonica]|uniref:Uncharacterized protein n=1 Tax=Sphingomonas japonica TaxID=511662 RepID=A0ABX0U1W7_9SPHN|nr:hypothetical protein [Sphingomonas japonica]NIJ24504.1 hypothetical protein [Sphingomonas japonica]